ncbi:MAG: LuxR C-terminal-related transcriptional regulator [Anaerotignaceae bacterium]
MNENIKITLPQRLQERFEFSFKHNRILIFHAPCGFGKTCMARELTKKYNSHYISVADKNFSLDKITHDFDVLIIDDLQMVKSTDHKQAISDLVRTKKDKKFLLITRGAIAGWLIPLQSWGITESFSANDFSFQKQDLQAMADTQGVVLSNDDINSILADTKGFPVALAILFRLLSEKKVYTSTVLSEGRIQLFFYFDEMVYKYLPSEVQIFLVSLSAVNTFNLQLAQMLSGNSRAGEYIVYIQENSSMLLHENMEKMQFRPIFKAFLYWKLTQLLSLEEQKSLFARAGMYYEQQGDMKNALDCYNKISDYHKISELLVKNSKLHVGIGQYLEMEKYYFALPEEEILQSPTLMGGMSMLCSLSMDYEQSEYWYQALQSLVSKLKKNDELYKDAKGRLAYLDIALPQRGSTGVVDTIKKLFVFFAENQLDLPTFSVTSTLPSVMNGGKDFCVWSKKDDFFYATMKRSLELILGKDGVGLADCGICESKFEKGENYEQKLLTLLSQLTEIQQKGSPDIEFATIGLLARTQIAQGQADAALDVLNNLKQRYEEIGEHRFIPNLDAFICRIYLLKGDFTFANRWLKENAPKEEIRIWALHRYQYLTKSMAQLAMGTEGIALIILIRLLPYTQKCGRTMDEIYVHILIAICYYRMGNDQWNSELLQALDITYEHNFVRPIAQYGVAILPLLTSCNWSKDKTYLEKVIKATRVQAVNYPLFLKPEKKLMEPLTATEKQVLKLLCHNMSNLEIGDILGIKLATVKTHVSRILQKLEINRRSEAKEVAEELGLF